MRARLAVADDRINWAAVAGALCVWDVFAKYTGRQSASRWFRSHPPITVLFLLALTNHLTRKEPSGVHPVPARRSPPVLR